MAKATCESCGPVEGPLHETFIYARGYWWHRKCAAVRMYLDGKEYVDFPSDGKLLPSAQAQPVSEVV